jgi:hypothetical protein
MSRRYWLASMLALIATALGVVSQRALAGPEQANLNETLRYALRCRRPQEFAFVDLVTDKVKAGQLPTAMVLSMMKWAIQRSHERGDRIPFPYFQEGLRLRAKEIGVELPPLAP